MPERQAHLFEPVRPLRERFGDGFFRAAPPKPGVYIMGGEAGKVLYIGQSKNLRRRLGSYKNARLDRAPRKVVRLVHAVRSIVWEECPTEQDARLRENRLLRTHRPKFNVVNTWPRANLFIVLRAEAGRLELGLASQPPARGKIYGAFKGGCAQAYGALLRLLWAAQHQPAAPDDFPLGLFAARPPRQFVLPLVAGHSDWTAAVENYLAGAADELTPRLLAAVGAAENISAFQRNLHAADLEVLANFFERGPQRNHALRRRHGVEGQIIPQEELDDWLVVADGELL